MIFSCVLQYILDIVYVFVLFFLNFICFLGVNVWKMFHVLEHFLELSHLCLDIFNLVWFDFDIFNVIYVDDYVFSCVCM